MGLAVGLVVLVAGLAKAGEPSSSTLDLVMPGARPTVNDAYICASFDVSNMTGGMEPVHVTGFVPHAKANKAHHMLLYACSMPMSQPGVPYDCMHHAMCRWPTYILIQDTETSSDLIRLFAGVDKASCLPGPKMPRPQPCLKASAFWSTPASDAT